MWCAAKKNTEVDKIASAISARWPKWTTPRPATRWRGGQRPDACGYRLPEDLLLAVQSYQEQGAEDRSQLVSPVLRTQDPGSLRDERVRPSSRSFRWATSIWTFICSKLKKQIRVDVELESPACPTREKIRKMVQTEGKHKKRPAPRDIRHVKIEFEPR